MTERKTLNRYYPVDYDPAKIPKLKTKQKEQNRLWGIRVMAPFNMRCNTCGDYIYKGKKFNSKKETVSNEDYLGIEIHRFYIRCPKCVAVIAFKTDPKNCDYTLETGATRNFEAAKTLMDQEKKKQQAIEDEEAANPMKVLENRTKQSRNEMDTMEALTELREMNARHEKVDHDGIIRKAKLYQQELERLQKEEEDRLIRDLFGSAEEANGETIRRIIDSDDEDDPLPAKRAKVETESPSDLLLNTNPPSTSKSLPHKKAQSTKLNLSNLVRLKKPEKSNNPTLTTNSCSAITSTKQGTNDSNACTSKTDDTTSTNSTANDSHIANSNPSSSGIQQVKPIGALGMLGDYIYSSESGSDNE